MYVYLFVHVCLSLHCVQERFTSVRPHVFALCVCTRFSGARDQSMSLALSCGPPPLLTPPSGACDKAPSTAPCIGLVFSVGPAGGDPLEGIWVGWWCAGVGHRCHLSAPPFAGALAVCVSWEFCGLGSKHQVVVFLLVHTLFNCIPLLYATEQTR